MTDSLLTSPLSPPQDYYFGSTVALSGNKSVLCASGIGKSSLFGNHFIATYDISSGYAVLRSDATFTVLDSFGIQMWLSYDGNTLYISGNSSPGKFWRYGWSGAAWVLQVMVAGSASNYWHNKFGFGLFGDSNHEFMLIGNCGANDLVNNQGYVYLMRRIGNDYYYIDTISNPNAAGNDFFGSRIAATPDLSYVAIGSVDYNVNRGRVWLYKKDGNNYPIFASHLTGANNATILTDNSITPILAYYFQNQAKTVTDGDFPGGSAIAFDGSGDRVQVNLPISSKINFSDFTIRFKVKAVNGGSGDAQPVMVSLGYRADNYDGLHIYCGSPDSSGFYPRFRYWSRTNDTAKVINYQSTTKVVSNVVTEIELSRYFNAADSLWHYEFRVNGVSAGSITSTFPHDISIPFAQVFIGNTSAYVDSFNGKIGELRIWRGWGNNTDYTPVSQFSGNGQVAANGYKYLGYLDAFDASVNDNFSSGLALTDDASVLYVGSPAKNKVYVYDIVNDVPVYRNALTPSASGIQFGYSITAQSENDKAVGARSYVGASAQIEGAVYFYSEFTEESPKFYLFINL